MTPDTDPGTTDIVPLRRYFETASATTSPDNANSGNLAYVLTGVVLGTLVVLSLLMAPVLASVVVTSALSAEDGGASDGADELDELMERLMGETDGTEGISGQGQGQGSTSTEELSQSEALDLGLALYGTTVDDQVSATSYANVPDDVRTYVRALLAADRDGAATLSRQLNTAARGTDLEDNLQAALQTAADTKAAVESLEAPDFGSDEVNEAVARAQRATAARWDAVSAEVGLLQSSPILSSRLEEADDEVLDATEEAAEDVTEALLTAAR